MAAAEYEREYEQSILIDEVVLGERADKRNLDAQHIGNGLDGMQLLLSLLGLRLERNIGQQAHLVGER